MYLSRLRTVGGSVMFAVPKAILESLGLAPNADVGLSVSNGCLIVEPHPRPRHTLAGLLEQCDSKMPLTDEDKQWLEASPVGRESL